MSQIKVELQEWMGSDKSIAESAWTSSLDYQKKQTRSEADVERVVKMLADHKHSTPFESVVLKFWIKMPIAIDRQHMTHRIGSHNGMSGRYRTMPSEYLSVPEDIQQILQQHPGTISRYNQLCESANEFYKNLCEITKDYEKEGLLSNGEYKRIREFFRGVLPQHNMTERVTIFNLRSFANYMKLRDKPEAQPEIQEVAKLMLQQVKANNIAPIAIAWLEKNNWNI